MTDSIIHVLIFNYEMEGTTRTTTNLNFLHWLHFQNLNKTKVEALEISEEKLKNKKK